MNTAVMMRMGDLGSDEVIRTVAIDAAERWQRGAVALEVKK